MRRRPLTFALYLLAVLLLAFLLAAFQPDPNSPVGVIQTMVLYDGRLGGAPDDQAFSYLSFGPASTQFFAADVTVLDTTGEISDQAGYFNRDDLVLDRQLGYTLHFTIQIGEEEHLGPNRAGFSVIILSDDLLGLELGFWQNEIWAQEGGVGDSLFKHAEGVAFDTTADLTTYTLSILDNVYTLSANGAVILSGPLRDYTAFDGFPDVYESPGLLFLGDNTRRGATRTAVSYVALETTITATETPSVTLTSQPSDTPTPELPPTATSTPTVKASATAPPSPTAPPLPAATPRPSDKLYLWMACLKGVDSDMLK